jgi:predicted site-specific integrase-resolvase
MAGTNSTPLRAAVYARVSTTNHGQDVSLQTRELRESARPITART